MPVTPLVANALRRSCDPAGFTFTMSDELSDLDAALGQDRAIDALRFAIDMPGHGYNVFALGPSGTGRLSAVRSLLERAAAARPVPDDWCYVNNFEDPRKPRALRLPPGRARRLAADVSQLVDDLIVAIPAAFRREEVQARRAEIEEEFQERQHGALNELRDRARAERVVLIETPTGFAFGPLTSKGEALNAIEFEKLADEEKTRIQSTLESLQAELQKTVNQFPRWHKEMRDKLRTLQKEVAQYAVDNLMNALADRYGSLPAVVEYLHGMRDDIVDNVAFFLGAGDESTVARVAQNPMLARYSVNVLVDNGEANAAPVVHETLPTHGNLIGRTEYLAQMGTLTTDFTLIRAGALHRANGGYLILDARQLLLQPFAWEGLKRVLLARTIQIDALERTLSLLSTVSIEPQPIGLDVKVVLIGDRRLYYLLTAWDPEFGDLFKIAADFDDRIVRTPQSEHLFARMCATLARRESLLPVDPTGMAALVELGSRNAGDAERISIRSRDMTDLLREANQYAAARSAPCIAREDVRTAVAKRVYRAERVRERLHEEIQRGTLLIATDDAVVGQVNGLSVITLGDFEFGQPTRITATTRLGDGDIVDIERETELGGALHSKGVFILSSFLSARYAPDTPLSLAASLVFEQSYDFVEGDSASLGELCALLSALAHVGIRQSLAVTGSVNQLGQVQAIGGVNEKIEGFFDICARRGLNGQHGVLIPAANVKHLMLRESVVEAAASGRFHVYPVSTVDEALELLTGVPAGARTPAGPYPEPTLNYRIEEKLLAYAKRRQDFSEGRARPQS